MALPGNQNKRCGEVRRPRGFSTHTRTLTKMVQQSVSPMQGVIGAPVPGLSSSTRQAQLQQEKPRSGEGLIKALRLLHPPCRRYAINQPGPAIVSCAWCRFQQQAADMSKTAAWLWQCAAADATRLRGTASRRGVSAAAVTGSGCVAHGRRLATSALQHRRW